MSKDYLVTIKVKNNNILSLIKERGFKSVMSFCKKHNLQQYYVNDYINLMISPIHRGVYKKSAIKLADALGVIPETLFSNEQLIPLETNKKSIELNFEEIQFKLESQASYDDPLKLLIREKFNETTILDNFLNIYSDKQRELIEKFYGINGHENHTAQELGLEYNVSAARIHQIIQTGLRKIRFRAPCVYEEDYNDLQQLNN